LEEIAGVKRTIEDAAVEPRAGRQLVMEQPAGGCKDDGMSELKDSAITVTGT
jgi:hypothetical protein